MYGICAKFTKCIKKVAVRHNIISKHHSSLHPFYPINAGLQCGGTFSNYPAANFSFIHKGHEIFSIEIKWNF
jgi:hypothetical protein